MLVQNGTLKIGDYVLAGKNHGKVKAMLDERGKPMQEAGPSIPVTILGLDGAPTAGDKFRVLKMNVKQNQLQLNVNSFSVNKQSERRSILRLTKSVVVLH